jgi:hypothetical protein
MTKLASGALLAVLLLPACGGIGAGMARDAGDTFTGGDAVAVTTPSASQQELAVLKASLAAGPQTADSLLASHRVTFAAGLPYAPDQADSLDKIQASALRLSDAEMAVLRDQGFVISDSKTFLNFASGYISLYAAHLPLYVSADSILYAVHRSFDKILESLERDILAPKLSVLLDGMRTRLAATTAADWGDARADADLFLAVAAGLLSGTTPSPVAGSDAGLIGTLLGMATAASGTATVKLFGVNRDIDFSQFKPRGHYTDSPALSQYFRAMMWLGRTEFRLLETQSDGSQLFYRRQLEASLLMRGLVDATGMEVWNSIEKILRSFTGESDNMTLPEVDALANDLGASTPPTLATTSDSAIAQLIIDKGYGAQRIASQLVEVGPASATLPLNRSFLLFGQRYELDSHVFSNVVFDRVKQGTVLRMMPSPLDVAFAALDNDAAAALLAPELGKYDYASELGAMRILGDSYDASFWGGTLYNLWLSSLRALSPAGDLTNVALALPSVARTEPWSRRVLNTQLASWAELRHDTILYVKQSYTSGVVCEFPDGYVEPSPSFWSNLAAYSKAGGELMASLDLSGASTGAAIIAHFQNIADLGALMGDMAARELSGQTFTDAQLAYLNQAVTTVPGGMCGEPPRLDGWYPKLFFSQPDITKFDPTIADVHTQPTDEAGNPVGKILHVGTGYARLLVMTADTCTGARAYAGLTSSYYEKITDNYNRLDDPTWAAQFTSSTPQADVPWMQDLIAK